MDDVAQWLVENRENLAGLYGIPSPEDVTPEMVEGAALVLEAFDG